MIDRVLRALVMQPGTEGLNVRILPTDNWIDEIESILRFAPHIGLRYGLGNYPGLQTELLLDCQVFPGVQPALGLGSASAAYTR
jgi:hypothetical protein